MQRGGRSMMSLAAANIFRKALALKPDGLEGVLNNLDPEESSLKNLSERIRRRRGYLKELSSALNAAPNAVDKQPITRIVHPLQETVDKIQNWLNNTSNGLSELNRIVKRQNVLLANAIADFSRKNNVRNNAQQSSPPNQAVAGKIGPATERPKVKFVKAA